MRRTEDTAPKVRGTNGIGDAEAKKGRMPKQTSLPIKTASPSAEPRLIDVTRPTKRQATKARRDSHPHSPCERGARNVNQSDRRSAYRSEEHTSELQSHSDLVCRLLLEKKKQN